MIKTFLTFENYPKGSLRLKMFTNDKHQVYSFGGNNHGELGLCDYVNRNTPEIIENMSNIKSISKGSNHTLFLDFAGIIYSCGYNSNGELGLGHTQNVSTPTKIEFNTKVIYISCAGYATASNNNR